MSWVRDTQLFIFPQNKKLHVVRITKSSGESLAFGDSLANSDFKSSELCLLDIPKHLSSFYTDDKVMLDKFFAYVLKSDGFVNSRLDTIRGTTGKYYWSYIPDQVRPRFDRASGSKSCSTDLEKEKTRSKALQEKVTSLEATNSDLRNQVRRANSDKEDVITERDRVKAANKALEGKNTHLEGELKKEKDKNITLSSDVNREKVANQALQNKNSALKDELKGEKDKIITLTSDLTGEKTANKTLEEKNLTLQGELQTKKDNITTLTSDLNDEKAASRALQARNSVLEGKLKRRKNKIITLTSDLNSEKAANGLLEAKNTHLEGELQREKDKCIAHTIDSENEIAKLKVKNKDLDVQVNTWMQEAFDAQDQVSIEKTANQALQKDVAELKLKLEDCRRNNGGQPSTDFESWMNGYTFESSWVPFESLPDQAVPRKGEPLTFTKATPLAPDFTDDKTTNVKVSYLSRGILSGRLFPIVVVNVEELTPNKEKARFNPNIWSLFVNDKIRYASRKPFDSEMPVFPGRP